MGDSVATGVMVGVDVGVVNSMAGGWSPTTGGSVVGRVEKKLGGSEVGPGCDPEEPSQARNTDTANAVAKSHRIGPSHDAASFRLINFHPSKP